MAAFKLTQIYPAHVPYDTSPQYITFSTTAILSQTIDNLGKQLYFNLLLQIQRDSTKLVFLLFLLSYNYYILWPLLSEMLSPSKMLIGKLSLFSLTRTFIKCKPLCNSDGSEEAENPGFYPNINVATIPLLLSLVKERIFKHWSCHIRHLFQIMKE